MIRKPLENMDILLVEDNEMNTLLTSAIMHGTGANITEADNGIDAIQYLRSRSFDLVLMDLNLPLMDGFDTTRYIRDHISATLPIIAITANVVSGEEEKCKDAGMNGFISKPYSEKELLDKIAVCIPFEKGIAQTTEEPCSTVTVSSQLYNLSFLENVSKGNREMLQQIILLFVDQAPAGVTRLKAAYHSHDFNEIGKIAHRMKPDIDNLEIISLKDDIRQIETLASQKQNGAVLEGLINKLDDTIMRVVHELKANVLS